MERQIHAVMRELEDVLLGVNPVAAGLFAQAFGHARRIFICGAGRTGAVMRMFAMRLAQMEKHVFMVGDVTTPSCGAGDLLLIGSGSGSTATLLPIAQKAIKAGTRLFVLTRTEDSPLAELADHTLVLPVPLAAERPGGLASVQPLGTLFEQALMMTCDILVMQIMESFSVSDTVMQARHANLE